MIANAEIEGGAIIEAVAAAGIEFVVSVPDITTSEGLLRPIAGDRRFRLVRVCKEDEGVSICTGLAYCGKRALLLIQYTGLLDSLNSIRGIAVEYKQPVCMMVGLMGKTPGVATTEDKRYGVRIVAPILDAMGIPHALLEAADDAGKIVPAIERAYAQSWPTALFIGPRLGEPA